MLDFLICVGGIYACFLTWSAMQERVTTQAYGADAQKFQFTIALNLIQAMTASLVGFVYVRVVQRKAMLAMSRRRWFRFFQIAFMASVASPFGYMALRYINYPTMTLAKTCKLVPVMLMNVVLYKRKYAIYKYVVVAMITLGVSAFMLFKSSSKGGAKAAENSLHGLFLVFINLAIDGLVNSTQEQILADDREVTGQHMMCLMNLCSSILMALWLMNPFNPELGNAVAFLRQHPRATIDIGMSVMCGALGQCFIFYTLAKFGSLTLVTINVTRKFLTILFSVFYYSHPLNGRQWVAAGIVFAGIALDAYKKQTGKKAKKQAVVEMTQVGKGKALAGGELSDDEKLSVGERQSLFVPPQLGSSVEGIEQSMGDLRRRQQAVSVAAA
ncbi:UDP-galactose transporter [Linderina macrospora]|uniref:UDP-galactose transporter n=1 Tax=Linderina macrospora TaxID=4868 RepID=A0ACC1JAX0_9FUNG|nr:UDP-galactose transporter [Linderina macrospora]